MLETERKKLIAVLGPTASGKTALAVWLARQFDGEIISCDSMQIYRDLMIGTARPTEEEQGGIRHHLLGFADPREPFSSADYVTCAEKATGEILSRGKLPLFCGGTGLYFESFLRGEQALVHTPGDPAVRAALTERVAREGIEPLYAELMQCDPASCRVIHKNNQRRVIRAMEIYLATGKPKSEWDAESAAVPLTYRPLILALDYRDRSILHGRIERRVDEMLEAGLEAEVRALQKAGKLEPQTTAGQAIGYKEMLRVLDAGGTGADARDAIVTATRQYAKRQLTWLRRNPDVTWIYADDYSEKDALYAAAGSLCRRFLND